MVSEVIPGTGKTAGRGEMQSRNYVFIVNDEFQTGANNRWSGPQSCSVEQSVGWGHYIIWLNSGRPLLAI